jgi:histidine triad (HIT) family protein
VTGMFNHAPREYVCPFCLVAKGIIRESVHSRDSDIVARNSAAMALIASHWRPRNPGHVIVAPIAHYENLYDLPDEIGAAIFSLSRRIAIAMKNAYRCDGISTRQHNEPAGYQDVWHYHLHVFPRFAGDELYLDDNPNRLTRVEEREPYAAELRAALGAEQ